MNAEKPLQRKGFQLVAPTVLDWNRIYGWLEDLYRLAEIGPPPQILSRDAASTSANRPSEDSPTGLEHETEATQ